jgi:hypothetical protein
MSTENVNHCKTMTDPAKTSCHRASHPIIAFVAFFLFLVASSASVLAGNILANSSMESGFSGWTCYGRTGQEGWYSYALATVPDPTVTGNNSFKVYAGWNGDPNWNGTYQEAACLPTSTFTASGWFRTKTSDKIVGTYGGGEVPDSGNTCWLEVTFRDAGNNVLALYKSAIFDGSWAADEWFWMPITNQCDVTTGLPVASVTTLAAPAGTVKARHQIILKQSQWGGGGALFVDDMVLDQVSGPAAPKISNLSPGAILLANAANGLTFTASSDSGTTINATDIQVTLNGSNVSAGLLITGSDTNKSVSYTGLKSNQTYSVAIQVTDAFALTTSAAFTFDTWSPLFVWEGEDYDFNNGQYINAPVLSSSAQPDSYFGQVGSQGVDFNDTSHDGDHLFRSGDLMATTVGGDTPRKNFLDAQAGNALINDYKVGWFYTAEWVNYTRNFPVGTYNLYARLAGGAGAATVTLAKVTDGAGTDTQTLTNLGTFSFTGSSWSTYDYVPLRDPNGNLVPLAVGGVTTLRVTTGGGADLNFMMLVPADTNHPVISAVYPDGSLLLQNTNTLSFHVSSPSLGINNGSIGLVLNNVDVSANLVITGTANDKIVKYIGLQPNVPNYTAVISVTNASGISSGTSVHFDTFKPTLYSWECEDYDYNGGLYIDNPPVGAYYGLQGAADVDYHELFVNNPQVAYRTQDPMGTDVTGDIKRARNGTNDYNIGWFTVGEWVNWTRHYPAGNFHVYARFSRGTGTNATPTLSRVTSGAGTTTQTTEPLGYFSVDSHGWGSYAWIPLREVSSSPLTLHFDGSETTLRLTSAGPEANTEANGNFIMLVPVATPMPLSASRVGANMVISFPTETGFSYQVQYKNTLADANWTDLGAALDGNGSVQTMSDPASGSQRFYHVKVQ